jgi:small subunit ribosomal protein S1
LGVFSLMRNEINEPIEIRELSEKDAEDAFEAGNGVEEEMDFMALYEESLKGIQEGKIVKGLVVRTDKEFVLVDIGYKSEGQIPISQFTDTGGNLNVKVGDHVDVLLERKEDSEGHIVLSKEKAAKIKIWEDIKEAYENGNPIKGRIVSRVKGGLSVDIGLQAFLPGSQADLRPIRNLDALVGTEDDFKIIKYEKEHGNIVLSRRAIMEEERVFLREKTLSILKEEAVLDGIVKNITDYGLFVDLGGIDGLVHITDMSWSRVGHPSEMAQVGDQIKVKVLRFDKEKERVSLGIKQLSPDPWTTVEGKYPVGTQVKGRVVSLKDYGAFVEIEDGVEGLIHVSEMSWTKKIRHPSQIVNSGDMVDVVVLKIDPDKKRISLGMKQLETNPWDVVAEKFPVGTIIEGMIKNITDFGVFIGIYDGIDGLVHISDMSWTKRIKHPSELYKKGQEVQAVVLDIDKDEERLSLGIKQLRPDPWEEIPERYKRGTRVTGTVTSVADFGIFVQVEEGVEGLIHVSELPGEKGDNPLSQFQMGDEIEAKVINVFPEEKRIGLSMKKMNESTDQGTYRSYVNNQEEATSNLGELLKQGFKNLEKQQLETDSSDND